MAAPNITPVVTTNTTCDGLVFNDDTVYAGSDIASTDVNQATIRINYSTLGTYIEYVFTINTNVITAATLSVAGATPVNIFAELTSTVFPFVNFDLSADYGVTIPTVEDGVYYTTYLVANTGIGPIGFSYTGTQEILVNCATCCCITHMFQEIDPNCGCDDKKWSTAMRAFSYMKAAQFSTEIGNVDNAVSALNKASEICENGCGCGG